MEDVIKDVVGDPIVDFGTLTRGDVQKWGNRVTLMEFLNVFQGPIQSLAQSNATALEIMARQVYKPESKWIWNVWTQSFGVNSNQSQEEGKSFPSNLSSTLQDALLLFERDHWNQIKLIYSTKESGGIQEELLLIFYYAFSLRELTKQLISLADSMTIALNKYENDSRWFRGIWLPLIAVQSKHFKPNAISARQTRKRF